jgi:Xaa-Pro aminopeptidase
MRASLEERDRRWRNIRLEMALTGLDALIVVSDGHLERRGAMRYIADVHATLMYGYVVFPLEGEPVAICSKEGWIKDRRPIAFRGGWIKESELYAPAVVEVMKELKLEKARVGIEGDLIPALAYERLVRELPEATFRWSKIVYELKTIKSPEELKLIEDGVEMVDRAFDALLEFAGAGKTLNDMTGELCRKLYQFGTEDIGGYPLSHSNEVLKPGDVYNCYPEPQAPGGHWIQFGRLISIGEPKKELQADWELNIKAEEQAAEKLIPGNTGGDVMRAINEALKGSKYTGSPRGSGHGVGLDLPERPFIALDDETVIKLGMVVTIHPVFLPHPQVFEACADMFVVTEGKPRKLSRITPEIKIV